MNNGNGQNCNIAQNTKNDTQTTQPTWRAATDLAEKSKDSSEYTVNEYTLCDTNKTNVNIKRAKVQSANATAINYVGADDHRNNIA